MSMKKTDLEKHMAKKLDGRMKSGSIPQRYARGASVAKEKPEQKLRPAPNKLVAVSCRLPAELVTQLREKATGFEGGISALLTQAAEQWLLAASAAK